MSYTPSWKVDSQPKNDDLEKYGGGLDFESNDETTAKSEDNTTDEKDRSGVGEPRHPQLVLRNRSGWIEQVAGFDVNRCECSCGNVQYTISCEVDRFPPETELECSVFGIRCGDTTRTSDVTVVAADPFTAVLSFDGRCATLERIIEEGCLICGGDTEC